jgi:SsrA-binding protein
MELALARGKKSHDKREDIKKREQEREMRKALKRPLK